MSGTDQTEVLSEQVLTAVQNKQSLCIRGGDSKFLQGRPVEGKPLSVFGHQGIIDYAPTELVITARAGTSLHEIESQLAESKQMLPFEPPHLGEGATLGGTVACGLSGPRRPYAGAVRDMVLGIRMINGRGEVLNFGGQVMKNVAGYDVSRLMVGAQGTLGLILDVSIKVLPIPEREVTLCLEMGEDDSIRAMNQLAKKPLPLSAACYVPQLNNNTSHKTGTLWLRLSGVDTAVNAAIMEVGGEVVDQGQQFWLDLKERRLDIFKQAGFQQQTGFQREGALWRLSVPPASPPLGLPGSCVIDWGGAQRWMVSMESPEVIHKAASSRGGYATLYSSNGALLPPISPVVAKLHKRIKNALDPEGIFNPGRLYEIL